MEEQRDRTTEDGVYSRGAGGSSTATTEAPPQYAMFVRTLIPGLPWKMPGYGNCLFSLSDGLGGLQGVEGWLMVCVPLIHQRPDGSREYFSLADRKRFLEDIEGA